jgi:hypothetical protein
MKRPATKRPTNRSGNIRNDLTPEQLASIGAVAILYNEVELFLDIMVGGTLSIDSNELRASLTSRINGTDGKIEIMKAAAANLGAPEPLRVALAEALGLDGFGQLKAYRDVIIHARVLDSSVGIGISAPKRGKFSEILLTTAALDGVYERLELLRLELIFLTESLIPLVVSAEIERPLVGMGRTRLRRLSLTKSSGKNQSNEKFNRT